MRINYSLLAILFILFTFNMNSEVPKTMPFQGIVTDPQGLPVPDGTHVFTFRIFTTETGGNAIWEETQALTTEDGLYNAVLGNSSVFPIIIPSNYAEIVTFYVETEFQGEIMSPRILLHSVPFAFRAGHADVADKLGDKVFMLDSANGEPEQVYVNAKLHIKEEMQVGDSSLFFGSGNNNISGNNYNYNNIWTSNSSLYIQDANHPLGSAKYSYNHTIFSRKKTSTSTVTGNVGIGLVGTALPLNKLHIYDAQSNPLRIEVLTNNTNASKVLVEDNSGVIYYRDMSTNPFSDNDWTEVITPAAYLKAKAGGIATSGAILYGTNANTHINLGFGNSETGLSGQNYKYATVGGGYNNKATNEYATVSGGHSNTASGAESFIGGGMYNDNRGQYSIIGSGTANYIGGLNSFIGAGENHSLTGYHSAIVAGYESSINNGNGSFIGAGAFNEAYNSYAVIVGGETNIANSAYSTIVNGNSNNVTGIYSFIGNGISNTVNGQNSVIGNGKLNNIAGEYSSIPGGSYLKIGNRSFGYRGGINGNPSSLVDVTPSGGAGGQDETFYIVDTKFWFNFTNNPAANFRIDGNNDYLFYANAATDMVGIGTVTPGHKLHVVAAADPLELDGLQTDLTLQEVLVVDAGGVVHRSNVSNFADLDWQKIGNNVFTGHGGLYPSGNVGIGIGTTTPSAKLEVGGDAIIQLDLRVFGNGWFSNDATVFGNITLMQKFIDGTGSSGSTDYILTSQNGITEWKDPALFAVNDNDWTQMTSPAAYLAAKTGGIATSGAILYGTNADTHINLGFNGSETGTSGQNYGFATVGGGYNNKATNDYATVSGGGSNTASGAYSFIGGGKSNSANSVYSFIGSGKYNDVSGYFSIIGNGETNSVSGDWSVITGGQNNSVSGDYSIASGYNNSVYGNNASAVGTNNSISGNGSHVIGIDNQVNGTYNTAIGKYNKTPINIDNSYLLGDYLESTTDNAFVIGNGNSSANLTNSNDYSLIIGFNANPTVFVEDGFIGINDIAPDKNLDIAGDMELTGAFYDGFNASAGLSGYILSSTGTQTMWIDPATLSGNDLDWDKDPTSDNVFTAHANSDGYPQGYVGIGTNSPLNKLHIVDNQSDPLRIETLSAGTSDFVMVIDDQTGVVYKRDMTTNPFPAVDDGDWSEEITPAVFLKAKAGGIATNSAALFGTSADTHINLGFGGSETGIYNQVYGYATVGGGYYNKSTNEYSTVSGGSNNAASGAYSYIGGGKTNTVSGDWAVITGGQNNTVTGDYSSIASGLFNSVSGTNSYIGGGKANLISSDWSVITGGQNNTVTGDNSIASGFYNSVNGDYSSAVGTNNNISGDGSHVIGIDNQVNGKDNTVIGKSNMTGTNSSHSYLIGEYLETGTNSINNFVIGNSGNSLAPLTNYADNSLVIGFSNNATIYVEDQFVGINDITPDKNLDITGDMELTGAFYDGFNSSAGLSGYILSSTGTQTKWIDPASLSGNDLDWDKDPTSGNVFTAHANSDGYPQGYVGIGTNAPLNKLHIVDNQNDPLRIETLDDGTSDFVMVIDDQTGVVYKRDMATNPFAITDADWSEETTPAAYLKAKSGGIASNTAILYGTFANTFINFGFGNSVTGSTSSVLYSGYATVSGGRDNKATYDYTTVSGGWNNTASGLYNVAAGGNQNNSSGDTASTVSGGLNNNAAKSFSLIAGGERNNANASYSIIGGGESNNANSWGSIVVGGKSNISNGDYSFIGNGTGNITYNNYSAIVTGRNCISYGDQTFIGSGLNNQANSTFAVVVGGQSNIVATSTSGGFIGNGYLNTMSGMYSFIGNGWSNDISGAYSIIGNGQSNDISGDYSVITGGYANTVSGNYSIASGYSNSVAGNNASAVGTNNNISDNGSHVIGIDNQVNGENNTVIGKSNMTGTNANNSYLLGDYLESTTDNAFVIGNGNSTSNLVNSNDYSLIIGFNANPTVFVEDQKVGIGTITPTNMLHIVDNQNDPLRIETLNDFPTADKILVMDNNGVVFYRDVTLDPFSSAADADWSEETTPAAYLKAKAGGIATNDAVLIGIYANTHINLGFGSSETGSIQDYSYATVGGGFYNKATNDYATVSGGHSNTASGAESFVGGGNSNIASNLFSSVVGGWHNNNNGYASFIGSGSQNSINNTKSFIGAGELNSVSSYNSGVVAGESNKVTATHSFIGAGLANEANGNYSAVISGYFNLANADGAVIGGGEYNKNAGYFSIIGNGSYNQILGNYSSILGGSYLKIGHRSLGYRGGIGANPTSLVDVSAVSGGQDETFHLVDTKFWFNFTNNTAADFRIDGAGDNLFYADASANMVGIGTNAPTNKLHIYDSQSDPLRIEILNPAIEDKVLVIDNNGVVYYRDVTSDPFSSAADADWSEETTPAAYLKAKSGGIASNTAILYGTNANTHINFGFGNSETGISGTTNYSYATVGGGYNNKATNDYATVSGGHSNTASGAESFVGGGLSNIASQHYSTVAGGQYNTSNGYASFIGGGAQNSISNPKSFIGGGELNSVTNYNSGIVAGGKNKTTATHSFIGAGYSNEANGDYSAVIAGYFNIAEGYNSIILGGSYLKIGNNSLGYRGGIGGNPSTLLDVSAESETFHLINTKFWFNFTNNTAADFRIDGAGDNLFYADASTDMVGIGTNAPTNKLHIYDSQSDPLRIEILNPAIEDKVLVIDNNGVVFYRDVTLDPFSSSADADWSEETAPAAYLKAKSGGVATNDAILYGINANTHINLGFGNSVTGENGSDYSYATVSGGYYNKATNDYATVSGGNSNTAVGSYTFIGAGSDNIANGISSFVGAGIANTAGGENSAIVSGNGNLTNSDYTFIGGGYNNKAQFDYAIVVGGSDNRVTGMGSVIVGGSSNKAMSTTYAQPIYGFIGNGSGNNVRNDYAFVGNGMWNDVKGAYSIIGNGHSNLIDGDYSVITGGKSNSVSGDYSIASGDYNNVSGDKASATGSMNDVFGWSSHAFGFDNQIDGTYNMAIGQSNTTGVNANNSYLLGDYLESTTDNAFVIGNGNSSTNLTNSNDYSLIIGFNANPTVFVEDGFVGINDIAPDKNLDITGDMELTGAFYDGLNASPGISGYILSSTGTQTAWIDPASLSGNDLDWDKDPTSGNVFTAYANSDGYPQGYVGIGTNSPANKLHIVDNQNHPLRIETLNAGTSDFVMVIDDQSGVVYKRNLVTNPLPSDPDWYFESSTGNIITGTTQNGNPGGWVGIGTDYPGAALDVNGNAIIEMDFMSLGNSWFFGKIYDGMSSSGSVDYVLTSQNGYTEWKDPALFNDNDWSVVTAPAAYLKAKAGGIASNDAILYGTFANTHINLGFSGSETGTTGQNLVGATVGGGSNNKAKREYSTVSGGLSNTANGANAFIGSGYNNTSSNSNSVVAGGANNTASGSESFIGGGNFNTANGQTSFIGGGTNNYASNNFACVVGGIYNNSTGLYSIVGAGSSNNVSGQKSIIGAGEVNTITSIYSGIIAGTNNGIYGGQYSFIGAGYSNQISGNYSVVVGGQSNNVSGSNSIVGGGHSNNVAGNYSITGGGKSNTIAGDYSSILGGSYLKIGHRSLGYRGGIGANPTSLVDVSVAGSSGGQDETFHLVDTKFWFNFTNNTNADFRIDGANDNLLYADASADMIGIGTNAPTNKLTVSAQSDPLKLLGLTSQNLDNILVWDNTTGVVYKRPFSSLNDMDWEISGTTLKTAHNSSYPSTVIIGSGSLNSDFNFNVYLSTYFDQYVYMNNSIYVGGMAYLNNDLVVMGNANLGSDLNVNGGTNLGGDLSVNGNAWRSGSNDHWDISSDKRIKTNIQNVENSFDRILKLRPVTYIYNEEYKSLHPDINTDIQYSFIAQELAEVFPEAVHSSHEFLNGDSVPLLTVNLSHVNIVTIQAVQDLIKLNIEQQKTNIILEQKIIVLNEQLSELKQVKQNEELLKAKFEELQKIVLQLSKKVESNEKNNSLKSASLNK